MELYKRSCRSDEWLEISSFGISIKKLLEKYFFFNLHLILKNSYLISAHFSQIFWNTSDMASLEYAKIIGNIL